ncbi:MAG: hypothetical protein ACK59A_10000 [Cyanobacteriota bacterium]
MTKRLIEAWLPTSDLTEPIRIGGLGRLKLLTPNGNGATPVCP